MEMEVRRHALRHWAALAGIAAATATSLTVAPVIAQQRTTRSSPDDASIIWRNPLRAPAAPATSPAEAQPTPQSTAQATPHATPQPAARPAADLVREAYAVAVEASRLRDYSRVVALCEEARGASSDETIQDYSVRLLSWAHNRRGEIHARQGRETQALSDFEAAIGYDGTRWRAVHNRGVSFALAGEYEKAIADFSRTVELRPGYANAYFNRGEMYYQVEDFEASIADYSRAIHLDNKDIAAWNGRGHARFRLGRHEQALQDFNEALRRHPRHAAALANRADVYFEMGRFAEAVRDLRTALDIDGQLGHAYLSLAWILSTCPDRSLLDPAGAVRAAEQAIALDGDDDHRYLDALAAAHASAGNFGKAQVVVRKAMQRAPADEADRYAARLARYSRYQPLRTSSGGRGKDRRPARQASHELPASRRQHVDAQHQIGQDVGQHAIPDVSRANHQPRYQ